jgi:hypothetical protein
LAATVSANIDETASLMGKSDAQNDFAKINEQENSNR